MIKENLHFSFLAHGDVTGKLSLLVASQQPRAHFSCVSDLSHPALVIKILELALNVDLSGILHSVFDLGIVLSMPTTI